MNSEISMRSPSTKTTVNKIGEERKKMRDYMFHQYDTENAILMRNSAPPGIGKSYLTVEIIYLHPSDNFVIVIPDHSMSSGEGDLEDMLDAKRISWIHIYGKSQPHRVYGKYCLREDGEEYYPGCSFEFRPEDILTYSRSIADTYDFDIVNCRALCKMRERCPYKNQFMNLDDKQVIISVLEHASMFEERTVIFDESFEQKLLKTKILSKDQIDMYNIRLDHREKKKLGYETYTFFNKVELSSPIHINSQDSYFINNFFESTSEINAYLMTTEKGTRYCLFGILNNYLPLDYRRFIFNCATTPNLLMYKITDTEVWEDDWKIYRSNTFNVHTLDNPIIKFKHNWGKNLSNRWLDITIKYFKTFDLKNILIVSKKFAIDTKFKEQFPDAKFVHFNAGRGFNSADGGNELLIQYGRFGFTPLNIEMWRRIGFKEDLVREMEMSEMLQCLHRGRPLLHPELPIILMSDNKLFPDIEPISLSVLELFYEHLGIDLDLPNEEIAERIKINRNKLVHFKKFVSFVREHIYKI